MGAKLPREPARGNASRTPARRNETRRDETHEERREQIRDRHREVALDLVAEGPKTGEGGAWHLAGDSMRPLLRSGDLLEVVPCRRPSPGQLVLFRSHGQLICHRVLRADPAADTLELGGDHNRRLDHVPSSAVLGLVTAAERRGRRLLLDRGPAARVGRLVAAWHRLDRRLLEHTGRAARWSGRWLELARIALLHACAFAWWRAPRRR